jgi:hypothetical protein
VMLLTPTRRGAAELNYLRARTYALTAGLPFVQWQLPYTKHTVALSNTSARPSVLDDMRGTDDEPNPLCYGWFVAGAPGIFTTSPYNSKATTSHGVCNAAPCTFMGLGFEPQPQGDDTESQDRRLALARDKAVYRASYAAATASNELVVVTLSEAPRFIYVEPAPIVDASGNVVGAPPVEKGKEPPPPPPFRMVGAKVINGRHCIPVPARSIDKDEKVEFLSADAPYTIYVKFVAHPLTTAFAQTLHRVQGQTIRTPVCLLWNAVEKISMSHIHVGLSRATGLKNVFFGVGKWIRDSATKRNFELNLKLFYASIGADGKFDTTRRDAFIASPPQGIMDAVPSHQLPAPPQATGGRRTKSGALDLRVTANKVALRTAAARTKQAAARAPAPQQPAAPRALKPITGEPVSIDDGGNRCFLAAAIQAITCNPVWTRVLAAHPVRHDPLPDNNCFTCLVLSVLRANNPDARLNAAHALNSRLAPRLRYNVGRMEDVTEAANFLRCRMLEEAGMLFPANAFANGIAFSAVESTTTTCTQCHTESERDYINDTAVFPTKMSAAGPRTLEGLLRDYFCSETVNDYACTTCTNAGRAHGLPGVDGKPFEHRGTADKRTRLTRTPQTLTVSIGRWAQQLFVPAGAAAGEHEVAKKISDPVAFPLDLNMYDFVRADATGSRRYNLQAVTVHVGTADPRSGHYYTYVHHKDAWFKCNGTTITRVTVEEVTAAQAVELTYVQRRPLPAAAPLAGQPAAHAAGAGDDVIDMVDDPDPAATAAADAAEAAAAAAFKLARAAHKPANDTYLRVPAHGAWPATSDADVQLLGRFFHPDPRVYGPAAVPAWFTTAPFDVRRTNTKVQPLLHVDGWLNDAILTPLTDSWNAHSASVDRPAGGAFEFADGNTKASRNPAVTKNNVPQFGLTGVTSPRRTYYLPTGFLNDLYTGETGREQRYRNNSKSHTYLRKRQLHTKFDSLGVYVHTGCHWFPVIIDLVHSEMHVWDSSMQPNHTYYKGVTAALANVLSDVYGLPAASWKVVVHTECAQQADGSSCGVYTAATFHCLEYAVPFDFHPHNIRHWRARFGLQLIREVFNVSPGDTGDVANAHETDMVLDDANT